MLPDLTDDNRTFWTGGSDGRLHIPFCERCGLWALPVAATCPDCAGSLEARPVSGVGNVFSYTVNHHPYNPALSLPYVIAIVELVEQRALRIVANIVDCEPELVEIGMSVEVAFERHEVGDDVVYVPIFAPLHRTSSEHAGPQTKPCIHRPS